MKIFAYGSNMSLNRLRKRVPSAMKLVNGYIEGYQVKCTKRSTDGSGKATILVSDQPERKVWGVIFEIEQKEKPRLDKAEGLNNGYNETIIDVKFEAGTCNAQVYIADEDSIDEDLAPYEWYKDFIVSGARENELPKEYIDELETIKAVKDNDDLRRLKNEKILKGE
jgi:gamma-glutamylcyclotransferase